MTSSRRIVHLLDDLSMGGVTRALQNFEHPDLQLCGTHEIVDVLAQRVKATSPSDIAIIHFTSSWQKIPTLLKLKTASGFSEVILIEHTYTEGFQSSEVQRTARFRRMLKLAYALADRVVAVSNAQRDWIVSNKLANQSKVFAIPQSRVCDDLVRLPVSAPNSGPLRIGAFGRFHKQKGFDLLLQAMTKIPPTLATLRLAGTGEDAAMLKAIADGLPHVEFVPPFASPEAFLSSVDVVAIPSRWEAFGLVGTEARAAAKPIIVADIDGLRDQGGEHAFVHPCGDIDGIITAIRQAADARDLPALGLAARLSASDEYEQMIAAWAKLLDPR